MVEEYPYPGGEGEVHWISTEWLEEHINEEVVIVDVQPNIHDYITEHIPGAIYLNEGFIRSYSSRRPGVFMPPDVVQPYLQEIGLSVDVPAMVYTGAGAFKGWGDGLEQTMMAYSLVRYGHNEVYVLDGGLEKWKDEGREITQDFPEIESSDFIAEVRTDLYLGYDEFLEMKDRDSVALLDARPTKFYEGKGPWSKPGHIPGAISLPWASLMEEDNPTKLKSLDYILAKVKGMGITKDKTVICSCGTGREATNEFLLFNWYLDYPNVKIYEGSYLEWVSYPDNSTVTGKETR